ncbi:hypothetical protein CARUB_v10018629mg [Capsella rubella]|uniref:HTH myb-type domain-containing protein n=1 Tax=Capsella rubella TaxID=81985 RepID=R0HN04_9BRAS|nr:hypothetical protein CARUB_v10018629mg [Capsella rubella]
MVDCGVDAYQLPLVPRAFRSPRGRRLRPMRKRRSVFEVSAQVAGHLSGEQKNRVAICSLPHETKETKDSFVVNNFLETMEVEVKPQTGLEKPSKVSLSKDWLALGPSMSNSPITQEENFDSSSKIVKLCIKSLKISELLVDVPESATVGSVKLAVLEAVTRIIKDGLNIKVLLRGKTIDDDSKTLLQIGIPRDNNDDHNFSSLGFMLEPQNSETTTNTTLTTVSARTRLRQNRVIGSVDSNCSVAAKSVVPVRMKHASPPEMVQRRIRRPFTVSEVEALVQAVEKLGIGRWRDVKSHAFEHANHRTYVDLKDKWKTLVHTAKISARQRRGEPVPQDLLDRVLAAHAFWSDRTGTG